MDQSALLLGLLKRNNNDTERGKLNDYYTVITQNKLVYTLAVHDSP